MSQPVDRPEHPDVEVLPRILGPVDAMAIVVGSIIGSGVFLKAAVIARELGVSYGFGPTILVWGAVGAITLCGSLALAELAAMLPHAGGPYVYLREAYGRLWAFLWGWTEFWIVRTGSLGALACATVIYGDSFLVALKSQQLLPGFLAGIVPMSHWTQCSVAVGLVLAVSAVNVIGTRWSARVQNSTTVIKLAFLAFLIIGPLAFGKADPANLAPLWPGSLGMEFWRAIGMATVAVLWAYDGWINIAPVAEEIREPQRNVPLALMFGILIITGVYVGANLAYHLVLPMQQVADSQAVATETSFELIGPAGVWLASLGVMISTLGALNSNLLCGPRIYFAMARDRLFPAAIRQVHGRFQTPANAVIAQMAWSIVLILAAYAWTVPASSAATAQLAPGAPPAVEDAGPIASPAPPADVDAAAAESAEHNPAAASALPVTAPQRPSDAFDMLTDFVIFGGSIFYAMAVGAVFVMRWKKPELARPYKTWGYPFTPLLYLLAFGGFLTSMLVDKWIQSAAGSVLILAGVVAFYLAGGGRKTT